MKAMYKRCLAALDNSSFDEYIITQLEMLRGQVALGDIIFAHADPPEPERGINSAEQRADAGTGDPRKDLPASFPVEAKLKGARLIKLQGQPENVLAAYIKDHDIDLVCVGLKEQTSRFTQVGRRLLCMTDADVLFVPGCSARKVEKILIPTDLSKRSYELVENVQNQFPDADIQIFFVNYIPSAIVMSDKDRKRLIAESSGNLNKSMQHFIDNLNSGKKPLTYHYEMSEHFNAGYAIHEHAEKNTFDLIAIGRLSKLDKELPFLGSVTEKLLSLSNHIPVLVLNH